MGGYISTNVYTIPNVGVKTEMQIDLLQGNHHVNSYPNSRSYMPWEQKRKREGLNLEEEPLRCAPGENI